MRSVRALVVLAVLLIIVGVAVAVWIDMRRTILAREILVTQDGTMVFTIEEHDRLISFCANQPDSHRLVKMVVATLSKAEADQTGKDWIPREGYDPQITIDSDRMRVEYRIGRHYWLYDITTNQFLLR